MEPVPWCKPLRLLELFILLICFTLLFFTRNSGSDSVLPQFLIVFLFVCFGSLALLLLVDVVSQLVRRPTVNTPMIIVAVLGTCMCFASGVILIIFYLANYASNRVFRTMNVIGVLTAGSFFCSVVFLIDAIILIRFL